MDQLLSAEWVADRTLESFIYNVRALEASTRTSSSKLVAREGDPHAALMREARDTFGKLCDRSADIVFPALNGGLELIDVIDSVFDDDEWSALMTSMVQLQSRLPRITMRPETLDERFPWAVRLPMSPNTKRIAEKCLRSLNALYASSENLHAAGEKHPSSAPREEQQTNHLWFLSDPAVPPDLRRGMLAYRRGGVTLMATYPMTAPPAPNQANFKHVLKMLDFVTEQVNEYLGVLANVPAAKITLVKPDGSDLSRPAFDSIAPFREALRESGESDVGDPA